jgi:hypothetical protein
LVHAFPLRPLGIALKEQKLGGGLFGARLPSSSFSPIGAMFHDPIKQRFFEADVFAGFFALNPLVFQNFGTLGKELLVKDRILDELRLSLFQRGHLSLFFHKIWGQSTPNAFGQTRSSLEFDGDAPLFI